jgi:hypothetical protein
MVHQHTGSTDGSSQELPRKDDYTATRPLNDYPESRRGSEEGSGTEPRASALAEAGSLRRPRDCPSRRMGPIDAACREVWYAVRVITGSPFVRSRRATSRSARFLSAAAAARRGSRRRWDGCRGPRVARFDASAPPRARPRHGSPISSEAPKDPEPTHAPDGRRIPRAGGAAMGPDERSAPMPWGTPTALLIG